MCPCWNLCSDKSGVRKQFAVVFISAKTNLIARNVSYATNFDTGTETTINYKLGRQVDKGNCVRLSLAG